MWSSLRELKLLLVISSCVYLFVCSYLSITWKETVKQLSYYFCVLVSTNLFSLHGFQFFSFHMSKQWWLFLSDVWDQNVCLCLCIMGQVWWVYNQCAIGMISIDTWRYIPGGSQSVYGFALSTMVFILNNYKSFLLICMRQNTISPALWLFNNNNSQSLRKERFWACAHF